jgi:PAS domain S-box-containing protein
MAIIAAQDGRFLAANPAFESLTGHAFSELQWLHLWELWRPDRTDEARLVFRDLLKAGSGSGTEVPLLKKDGQIITAEFAARALRYQGQDALLSIMVDITPRKEAERRDARLDELRTALQGVEPKTAAALEAAAEAATQASALSDRLTGDSELGGMAAQLLASMGTVSSRLAEIQEQTRAALGPRKE